MVRTEAFRRRFHARWTGTCVAVLLASGWTIGSGAAATTVREAAHGSAIGGPTGSQNLDWHALAGIWQGTLSVPGLTVTLVVKMSVNENGTPQGTIDIPEQEGWNIPAENFVFVDRRLQFDVKAMSRRFEGRLTDDRRSIEGMWLRGAGLGTIPVTLTKVDRAPELRRPQAVHPPYPYRETLVTYTNPVVQISIAGTLTVPPGAGRFPAVLLISGSGAQDRDETIAGHKPFLVLADDLTRRGIAVLRVDDRGAGSTGGSHLDSTLDDLVRDVLCGLDFLRTRPEIDPNKIGLLGHSEGGAIAFLAAAGSDAVAFVVAIGAPGISVEENLYLQGDLIRRSEQRSEAAIALARAQQQRIFAIVKGAENAEAMRRDLRLLFSAGRYDAMDAAQKEAVDRRIAHLVTPYFGSILTFDPRPVLPRIHCPVLAVAGEKDMQAPPRENLAAIEAGLLKGGNTRHVVSELKGLNHLLQTAPTGSPNDYSTIEETMARSALETIGGWIVKVVR
jgi:pimeloyl-ACP methyl ester carboxylesterase